MSFITNLYRKAQQAVKRWWEWFWNNVWRKPFPKDSSAFFIVYVTALILLFVVLFLLIVPVLWIAFPKYAALLTDPPTAQDAAARYPAFIGFFGILTAIGALVGYAFSFIRVFSTERQTITSQQGHITERINKAVENLGTNRADGEPNIEVRLGAIYALERIAQDSPRDHIPILEILSAYIRLNAPANTATQIKDGEEDTTKTPSPPIDIQTVLTVIGRNPPPQNTLRVDLRHCNLQQMDMEGLTFWNAILGGSKLEKAYLGDAHLQGAILSGAHLQGANLNKANLQGAILSGANLQQAELYGANWQGAVLIGANLQRTYLRGVDLHWAKLAKAEILTQNQINDAFGDAATTLPAGLNRPAHWPDWELDILEHNREWKKWQENPTTYTPPPKPPE